MTTPLVLIGGGGHCRALIDVIESRNDFFIEGIIDDCLSGNIFGYPILGGDAILPEIFPKVQSAVIAVGQIKTPNPRVKLYKKLLDLGYQLPIIISAFARFSKYATIRSGSTVMHGAVVLAGVQVGSNVIINNQALIEHDCVIGDNCHISTGAILNGGVEVGKNCFIGSGTIVREGVCIGNGSVIAMGSIVTKSMPPNSFFKNTITRII